MKRNVIGMFTLLALVVLLSVVGASAQDMVQADVPFAFTVGKAQLPAGCYRVEPNNLSTAVAIRNCESRRTILAAGQRDEPISTNPKLVFLHVGNHYFLTAVRGAASYTMSPPDSKLLKEIEAADGSTGSQVTIALK